MKYLHIQWTFVESYMYLTLRCRLWDFKKRFGPWSCFQGTCSVSKQETRLDGWNNQTVSARVSDTHNEGEIKEWKPMDIFKGAQLPDSKIDQSFIFSSFHFTNERYISWPSQIVHCPVVRGLPKRHQRDKSEYWWDCWEDSDFSYWLTSFHGSSGFQSLIFNKIERLD